MIAGLRTVVPAAPPLPVGGAVAAPLAALAATLLASLLVGLFLSRAPRALPAVTRAHRRLVHRIAAPVPTRAIRRAGRNRPAVSAPAP